MKRMILSPDGGDNSNEHTSHLPDDVTMPSLTIRYPPVFDDDVACQQYQYQHQRRPSYRPSLYQTDHGQGSFVCDSQQTYGRSGWQGCPRTGDYSTDPYEQAVDFSMNRSTSQETEDRVHLTPPSLTLAHGFRTATSTPCRLPPDSLIDNSGHLYSDRPPHLPYIPQDETDNMFSLPQRSAVSCASAGGVGGVPETLLQQCEDSGSLTDHRRVPADLRAGFGYDSPAVQRCPEQMPERLVYYDMDTPQREVLDIREAMTPQVKIKEETCEVPLQMRALLP